MALTLWNSAGEANAQEQYTPKSPNKTYAGQSFICCIIPQVERLELCHGFIVAG